MINSTERLTLILLLSAIPLSHLLAAPLNAESGECRDDLRDSDGYIIRSITVEGRWVSSIPLPIKPGDAYSNIKIQEALEAVEKAVRSKENQTIEFDSLGSAGVLYVTRCLKVERHEVDVVIQPRYVRVDLYRVGSNILPIPRSFLPTFYESVPPPLLAFNPVAGAYQDSHYGFASTFGMSTSLLDLPQTLKGQPPEKQDIRLDLNANGRKSFEHGFYSANADLSLSKQSVTEYIQNLALEINYQGEEEPLGTEALSRQALKVGGNARLRLQTDFIHTLLLSGEYRWSENHMTGSGQNNGSESAFEGRMIAEGRMAGGFMRGGIWTEAGSPEHGNVYDRASAVVGFEKEFLLAENQTVRLEAIVAGGRAWGAPQYARFFGGNSDRNFLYDSLDSPSVTAAPSGPWIRSFGEGQAFARRNLNSQGGTSYWSINLNVSLPIPRLSSPLIPDEEAIDGVSLKQLLKTKAGDSVSFYAADLQKQGLSPEEALSKAKATYGEVKPAIDFLADRANVYSLKPLIMCDVAQLNAPGADNKARLALGGGVQLTIVTAKFEVGYMRTMVGEAGDPSGNFVARITFENLF